MAKNKFNHTKKISYLDGERLKRAIIAGSKIVAKMQEKLNAINVFPVADGDTGTNMTITMSNISDDISTRTEKSISQLSSHLAEAALMGAQGNSGVILAQFFHGFAESVKGKIKLTTSAFATAVQHAKTSAYQALSDPKEGTILTVISDWASDIERNSKKTEDFATLLKNGLYRAKQSLAETPQKLNVLKKAGVVDAGAQGFVHLLEGIVHFIERGKINQLYQQITHTKAVNPAIAHQAEKLRFRFCIECLVTASEIDFQKIKNALFQLGDSLIVAGGGTRAKIHIHTNTPDEVFTILRKFGNVSSQKMDDMLLQHTQKHSKQKVGKIAIVTDSSCDLPADFIEENHVHIIPLKIIFGNQVFLDKVDITPEEFYQKLVSAAEHPKTSQPTIADIRKTFENMTPYFEKIISIHLPRVVSGTLQSIETAARSFNEDKIICVDGKNISGALGLVIMEAVTAIKENKNVDQVLERVHQAIQNIHIFISLPTIKYLVKGGRISKPRGFIGKLLRLCPIVSFDKDGRVFLAAKAFGEKASMKRTLKMLSESAKKYQRVRFIIAHANAPEKAAFFVHNLSAFFPNSGEIPIVEAAPVLGVHAGPGTVGAGFLGYSD
ncbi:MAG: DegV family protein [bacterium]|nr:DegV family protein [bacterium]